MTVPKLLEGYKVLELATVLAGPSVGMFLAELGAEVTKVENPAGGGDITRKWKLPAEDPASNVSAYFCSANWGKKHIFLNLKDPEHRRQAHELVAQTDIIISNFKKGDDVKLGMDYAELRKIRKDIIYAAINAYGEGDERIGYDLVLQAEGGFMSMNGTPESGPLKMPLAMVDMLAAHQLKEGILLALLNREKTGKGAYVSCSLFNAAVSALTNQATNWLMAGQVAKPSGSAHPNIAPYGEAVTTSDGLQIVLAIGTGSQFEELCRILRVPSLISDIRFAVGSDRVQNREELIRLLRMQALQFNSFELLPLLHKAGVPAGVIKEINKVLDEPAAREMILDEKMEGKLTRRVSSIAFNLREF